MRNIHKSIWGILGTNLYYLSAAFETFDHYILLEIRSPWKDWKKSRIMETLLSLRNTQKMVLCQCLYAPNAVFCVVAKGPNASQGLNSSDGEGMVST